VGGVTSYLEVTTAQSAALSDELTAVKQFSAAALVDAVTLVQLSVAAGSSALPERPECCGKLTSNSKVIEILTKICVAGTCPAICDQLR